MRNLKVCLILSTYVCFFTTANIVHANSDFFSAPIDYFGEKQKQPKPQSSFNWSETMDIGSDEFFREGNYLPPAAFMEVARRPTHENISKWLQYQRKKQNLTHRINREIERYEGQRQKVAPTILVILADEKKLSEQPFYAFTDLLRQKNIEFKVICSGSCTKTRFQKANATQEAQAKNGLYRIAAKTKAGPVGYYTAEITGSEYKLIQTLVQHKKGEKE